MTDKPDWKTMLISPTWTPAVLERTAYPFPVFEFGEGVESIEQHLTPNRIMRPLGLCLTRDANHQMITPLRIDDMKNIWLESLRCGNVEQVLQEIPLFYLVARPAEEMPLPTVVPAQLISVRLRLMTKLAPIRVALSVFGLTKART